MDDLGGPPLFLEIPIWNLWEPRHVLCLPPHPFATKTNAVSETKTSSGRNFKKTSCRLHQCRQKNMLMNKKNPLSFCYTGWLIGILVMVYYNPYITGEYNPLYNPTNQGFFHFSTWIIYFQVFSQVLRKSCPWLHLAVSACEHAITCQCIEVHSAKIVLNIGRICNPLACLPGIPSIPRVEQWIVHTHFHCFCKQRSLKVKATIGETVTFTASLTFPGSFQSAFIRAEPVSPNWFHSVVYSHPEEISRTRQHPKQRAGDYKGLLKDNQVVNETQ